MVQRGLYEDTAQYKLQVDHGAFSCRVAGSEGEAVVSAPGVVEPGEWYRVSCEWSDDNVVLSWERLADTEEGTTVRRSTIGDVTFPAGTPFVVGGKLDARGEVTVNAHRPVQRSDRQCVVHTPGLLMSVSTSSGVRPMAEVRVLRGPNPIRVVVVAHHALVGDAVRMALSSRGIVATGASLGRGSQRELVALARVVSSVRPALGLMLCDVDDPVQLRETVLLARGVPIRWLLLTSSQDDSRWGAAVEAGVHLLRVANHAPDHVGRLLAGVRAGIRERAVIGGGLAQPRRVAL